MAERCSAQGWAVKARARPPPPPPPPRGRRRALRMPQPCSRRRCWGGCASCLPAAPSSSVRSAASGPPGRLISSLMCSDTVRPRCGGNVRAVAALPVAADRLGRAPAARTLAGGARASCAAHRPRRTAARLEASNSCSRPYTRLLGTFQPHLVPRHVKGALVRPRGAIKHRRQQWDLAGGGFADCCCLT